MATTTVGTATDAWIDALGPEPAWQQIPWPELRNRPLTQRERAIVREYYNARYPISSDYTAHHPWHVAIAQFRVGLAQAVFGDLGRTIDLGCSAGEVVAAARSRGVDAWGFDLCPDLADVAYPEVREFVRVGRFDHMPFSGSAGFRTAVSYDVFEHVPIDELERMPDELLRLGIKQIACIISKDTITPEHITIQDTGYYVELLGRAGFRMMTELDAQLAECPVPAGWDEARQQPVWRHYTDTGAPRNGWNQVPGHLFFVRD